VREVRRKGEMGLSGERECEAAILCRKRKT
jgi:hypothetical protein